MNDIDDDERILPLKEVADHLGRSIRAVPDLMMVVRISPRRRGVLMSEWRRYLESLKKHAA